MPEPSHAPAWQHVTASSRWRDRVVHVEQVPARGARSGDWPAWLSPRVREALEGSGVRQPWSHQSRVAELAHDGSHVALSTGTASGKTVAFWMPAIDAALAGRTVIYVSPTKALAHDQVRALRELAVPGLRFAAYDGDTDAEERTWARRHAAYVLTNPDMLHHSILPGHARWSAFMSGLGVIVIDECHAYRGVFGSHVAGIIRRLRRLARRHGADPVVIAASATVSDPAGSVGRLIGAPATAVTDDGSPRGPMAFALWEPPLTDTTEEHDAPARRSAVAESADLLADLVAAGTRTLAFARSRRAAEAIAMLARQSLDEVDPGLGSRVAAYRGGYLPEERRALEADVRSGALLGLATTSALELGVDISGLDAVVMTGWPGTRASLWQQAGRAGRARQDALAILVARDDPLDTYLVHHPEAVFGTPVEATVLDPDNPYVLGPHLCAAASELPLTEPDAVEWFGAASLPTLDGLVAEGLLRRRPAGWYWTRPERASDLADLRGTGGTPIRVVEAGTGRLLGTVDPASAHSTVHEGAVYVHQGAVHVVIHLDTDDAIALVEPRDVDYTTQARDVSEIRIVSTESAQAWGESAMCFGTVEVTSQVVAFVRRRATTGETLGQEPLDLPPRHLRTRAVWWTATAAQLDRAGLSWADVPGAAHAAEHAAIGLLPLVATCDRWDIGGVSTALHEDTGQCTVFVYDGQPGGAGFGERGFHAAATWLAATREAIESCECATGCPSCVQSPKCGNGNDPLDKAGAVRLLAEVLAGAPG